MFFNQVGLTLWRLFESPFTTIDIRNVSLPRVTPPSDSDPFMNGFMQDTHFTVAWTCFIWAQIKTGILKTHFRVWEFISSGLHTTKWNDWREKWRKFFCHSWPIWNCVMQSWFLTYPSKQPLNSPFVYGTLISAFVWALFGIHFSFFFLYYYYY